jgi:hypothetical protein
MPLFESISRTGPRAGLEPEEPRGPEGWPPVWDANGGVGVSVASFTPQIVTDPHESATPMPLRVFLKPLSHSRVDSAVALMRFARGIAMMVSV